MKRLFLSCSFSRYHEVTLSEENQRLWEEQGDAKVTTCSQQSRLGLSVLTLASVQSPPHLAPLSPLLLCLEPPFISFSCLSLLKKTKQITMNSNSRLQPTVL